MSRKLPVVLQTEATECGLACLAMIARYYGHNVDLNVLRDKHLISLKGATLKSLMNIAGSLQMAARPLRLDMDHLDKLQLPALLHWDMNHFVVLKKIKHGKAYLHDPGVGLRIMSLAKMGKHFTGVALEVSPTAEFSPIDARLTPHLKLLWSRLVGLKRAIIQTLTLSIILQIALLAAPFYLQLVIDGALPSGNKDLLLSLAIGFGALAILRAVSEAFRGWALLVFGNQMSLQMIGNVFRHLIRLPTGYFEKRHVGDLISRMGSTKPIQEALTQSVVGALIDGVMAGLMLIVMFLYSPLLAIVVIGSVSLMALSTLLIYPHLRRTQEEAIYAKAIENTHVIETIRASTTIKLFGREYEREAAWRNLYTDFINANVEYGKYTIWQKFFETLLVGLQIIIVIYLAATLMMPETSVSVTDMTPPSTPERTFTVGMLLAFLGYRQYFTDSVTQLLQKGIEFKLLSLHLDRLADIIFAQTENFDGEDTKEAAQAIDDFKGRITLKNLWFRYSDLDPWVIEDFSADIQAGSMVTFTGPSGGGKTTLMKIILGLYTPTRGEILIDGRPLTEIGVKAWRSRIGVVMQEDSLLSGTIADNISFFDPELDMGRVVHAARTARIHDDIVAIPMNYMSMVGNMGSVLSGGQKQRVLLARALYNSPSVLFLDEGTANLDVETEIEIVDTLKNLNITRVIIAHRPAFIESSQNVLTV